MTAPVLKPAGADAQMARTRAAEPDLAERCVAAGMKLTAPRRAVVQVLTESSDHPSVETVYERARAVEKSISIATVYRTLNMLDELGLVQRHEFTGSENCARFEANTEHHHHLVDLETGEVVEFQNAELERLKEAIARELGFELLDHRLELYGVKKKP